YYSRIVTSSVVDETTERLSLDGEELKIKREDIAKISFLTLSRLESDQVTWTHHTDADGVATVTVSFRGLRDELGV
ncbi:TPA: phage tail protein, partial [Pasteurella multocida]|nr:phage tail protein [Pasteurella multocida]